MKLEREFLRTKNDAMIEKALEKAEALLRDGEIKMDDFVHLYGEGRLQEDKLYVEERERSFKESNDEEDRQNLKWSRVFEGILHQEGEQSNWFGPQATTIKTSRFDDYKNGVDEIIEFEKEDSSFSFLALAVDATFSHDTKDKLKRIKKEIDSGELASIRYFAAENVDIQKELKSIPHVIVGADRKTVAELSELWLTGKNKELANHAIQFQILEEVIMQCNVFSAYARKMKKEDVAFKYDSASALLEDIIKKKKEEGIKDMQVRDTVYRALSAELSQFEQL
jgi:hypothetical protein